MDTADKLNKLLKTKNNIRESIISKGVKVPDDAPFAHYPTYISDIKGGSGGNEELTGSYVIARFDNNLEESDNFTKKATEMDVSHLDTSNMRNMNNMFSDYNNLKSLDLSSWDTSNVENMREMFWSCRNLESLDLSNWNTSNVREMQKMFLGCENLESLDLSNWDTSNVESMYEMFSGCENLRELNLSSFEIRKDCDTDYMLNNCRKLHTLRLDNCSNDTINKIITSTGFPTELVDEKAREMWVSPKYVADLTAPDGWKFFDCFTGEVIVPEEAPEEEAPLYTPGEFMGNSEIVEVNTSVTSDHVSLYEMFSNCGSLTTVNTQDWDTSNVTDMRYMFYNCSSLTSLDLSNFDTSKVTDMHNMFYNCYNLKSLDLRNFDMTNVYDYYDMFFECRSLETVRLDNCNVDTVMKILDFKSALSYTGGGTIYISRSINSSTLPSMGAWRIKYVD